MSSTNRRVAYAYDDVFLKHNYAAHPENARRLTAIMSELASTGLLEQLLPLPVSPAPLSVVTRIHDPRYVAWLERASQDPPYFIEPNTYVSAGSYQAAMSAVGAAVECLRAVLDGQADSGMALVRPPGHHALRAQPFGFCLLNNIACAAAHAIEEADLDRVMIVDFDLHHGNGTQDAFYDDPRVYYISIHQYQWPFFPGTGTPDERGRGPGHGFNANIALAPGAGDLSYQVCLDELVAPLAETFQPAAILVSAGYDGHWRESAAVAQARLSNADMRLSIGGFDLVAQRLTALADRFCHGRIVFVLEGGYDREVLALSLANLTRILLGHPEECLDPLGPSPLPPKDDLDHIRSLQARFNIH
ncbi:MAG: histone deacetylase family protein [Anaerolineae bacterium]